MSYFPITRLRRTRQNKAFRSLVRETHITKEQLVYPLFITEGIHKAQEISAMPGIMQWSLKDIHKEIQRVVDLGITAVLLFGTPDKKDEVGSEAYNEKGITQQAIQTIKSIAPELLIITDVCLCAYTSHGHCGVIKNTFVDNDESVSLLAQMALSHAKAGADMIAPSDMMDGRITAIRQILDNNTYTSLPLMAYSAKYASAFYGPFREATKCAPQFGDRASYQMDPANVREALHEIALDIQEGADIIMVKPALSYMDVIRRVRERYDVPIAAYNVSGEYAMIKAASQNGWIDEQRVIMEMITSIRRAGANIIITYFAPQIAEWLSSK